MVAKNSNKVGSHLTPMSLHQSEYVKRFVLILIHHNKEQQQGWFSFNTPHLHQSENVKRLVLILYHYNKEHQQGWFSFNTYVIYIGQNMSRD